MCVLLSPQVQRLSLPNYPFHPRREAKRISAFWQRSPQTLLPADQLIPLATNRHPHTESGGQGPQLLNNRIFGLRISKLRYPRGLTQSHGAHWVFNNSTGFDGMNGIFSAGKSGRPDKNVFHRRKQILFPRTWFPCWENICDSVLLTPCSPCLCERKSYLGVRKPGNAKVNIVGLALKLWNSLTLNYSGWSRYSKRIDFANYALLSW